MKHINTFYQHINESRSQIAEAIEVNADEFETAGSREGNFMVNFPKEDVKILKDLSELIGFECVPQVGIFLMVTRDPSTREKPLAYFSKTHKLYRMEIYPKELTGDKLYYLGDSPESLMTLFLSYVGWGPEWIKIR